MTFEPRHPRSIHPLHAVLLAGTIPLFLGAALSDVAYGSTYEIQWTNFASWLIVGGLVFASLALLFAIVDVFRGDRRTRRGLVYAAVLFATWVIGVFNALWHARDAWASMPAGLLLSIIATVLACAAAAIAFSAPGTRATT